DQDVELVIFECRVKQFFERGLQAMHFVDEEHLLLANVGQNRREIAFDLQRRPGSLLERDAQLVGDDRRQSGFAQAWRAVEQNVMEGLAAGTPRLNGDRQVLFDFGLADELRQLLRAQLEFKRGVLLDRRRRHQSLFQIRSILERSHWPDSKPKTKVEQCSVKNMWRL